MSYHEARANDTREKQLRIREPISFSSLQADLPQAGVFRVKVVYGEGIIKVEVAPYEMTSIHTLTRIHSDILYDHKYTDRQALDDIYAQRGEADDVLIVKNGLVTDTTIANVAFFDGQRWLTPTQPLLKGTFRARLLDRGAIREAEIEISAIERFQHVAIMNALRGMQIVSKVL